MDESQLDPYLERVYKRAKLMTKLLNWSTFFVILFFDCFFCYYIGNLAWVINQTPIDFLQITNILGFFRMLVGFEKVVTASLFLLVGFGVQFRLKKYFPDFYLANKNMVWKAILLLSFSLYFSGIQTLLFLIEKFREKIYKYVGYWNLSITLFGTILPTCLQLTTLVFGYIRRKKNQSQQLTVRQVMEDVSNLDSIELEDDSDLSNTSGNSNFFEPPLLKNEDLLS